MNKSTSSSYPNAIQNIPCDRISFAPSLDKLKMQRAFILDGNAAIAIGLQDHLRGPAVIEDSNVGIVQVRSGRPNGKVNRSTAIALCTIKTVATGKRRGERETNESAKKNE
jgi:hypothetical protein